MRESGMSVKVRARMGGRRSMVLTLWRRRWVMILRKAGRESAYVLVYVKGRVGLLDEAKRREWDLFIMRVRVRV